MQSILSNHYGMKLQINTNYTQKENLKIHKFIDTNILLSNQLIKEERKKDIRKP
jgi:hypothetical protein